eukprot:TRINITY_DN27693_c0_g1_i1.p1 TRINITY_DN27693_c0_g1~~TRINITY_DN27693_c0_g1_i1.p1  ORF type:complete len:669 (+),score=62.86 TRINITY_DN27693_c0_g1_i1:35-2008(+)
MTLPVLIYTSLLLARIEYLSSTETLAYVWDLTTTKENLLLAASGSSGLVIFDEALKVLGRYKTPDARSVAVRGNTAYLADFTGTLFVVDVTDPTKPFYLASFTAPSHCTGVTIHKEVAYLSTPGKGVISLNISNPWSPPTTIGIHPTPGLAANTAVSDEDVIYHAGLEGFVNTKTGGTTLQRNLRGIEVLSDKTIAAAVGPTGVVIFSKSGESVQNRFETITGTSITRFPEAASDKIAVADETFGFHIIEKTLLKSYAVECKGVLKVAFHKKTNTVYLAMGPLGVRSVNLRSKEVLLPSAIHVTGVTRGVAVSNNTAYLTTSSGLHVIDVSVPSQPRVKTILRKIGVWRAVAVHNETSLYIAGSTGLAVFDTNNNEISREFPMPHVLNSIESKGRTLFATDGTTGLLVFDVPPDTNIPVLTSTYPTPGFSFGSVVEGGFVYVADSFSVAIVDLAKEKIVGSCNSRYGRAHSVAILGTVCFVAGGYFLEVFDVVDPSLPVFIGNLGLNTYILDIALSDGVIYLSDSLGAISAIDIIDPAKPFLVQSVTCGGSAITGLSVSGGIGYAAGSGLEIVKLRDVIVHPSPVPSSLAPVNEEESGRSSDRLLAVFVILGICVVMFVVLGQLARRSPHRAVEVDAPFVEMSNDERSMDQVPAPMD